MHNPHSPTLPWLQGVATGENGYYAAVEVGDVDDVRVEREGYEFLVTVECLEEP